MKAIELKEICVSNILTNISFSVAQGEICGLIGRSGMGKTTLLKTLCSLCKPTSGEIRLLGENPYLLQGDLLRSFRKKLGMIFQDFRLVNSLTVFENVTLAAPYSERKALALLDMLEILHLKNSYPGSISGGQKQRVAIARALVHDPEIILCDEMTASLDPLAAKETAFLLQTIAKERSLPIFFVTHQMEILRQMAERALVIDHGTIVEEGSIIDLLLEPKHLATKALLGEERLSEKAPQDSIELLFKGQSAELPLICKIAREFETDINILGGSIDTIGKTRLGRLFVQLEEDKKEKIIAFLTSHGVIVR